MRAAYIASLVLSISLALIYLFQDRYPDFMYFFSNIFYPLVAGVAVIVSGFALRKYWGNPGDKSSKIWAGFTVGMVFWFLGELSWAIYALLLNVEIPYPSIADVVWLIGYVPLFFALFLYIRTFQYAVSKTMFAIATVAVCIASLAFLLFLVPPIFADASEHDMVTLAVDIAYPALDIVLFSLSILGLLIFAKGKVAQAWLLINGAILMNVVGDVLFSYTTLQGTYYNGHWSELFFAWGYVLFALAFYAHKKEL
jgi:hypothetical protein